MNQIEEARAYFDKFYLDKQIELVNIEFSVSPSGKHELKIRNYEWHGQNAHADFARVEVWNVQNQEKVLEFNSEDTFWHIWISKDNKEYLVFAETRGGQSIIEFPDAKFESHYISHNDFIWTNFYPSLDKLKLAVFGCHWGWPWEIVIYDFASPMNLPFPIITRENLDNANEDFGEWVTNVSFSLIASDGTKRIIILPNS
jgi:hypothetical protein